MYFPQRCEAATVRSNILYSCRAANHQTYSSSVLCAGLSHDLYTVSCCPKCSSNRCGAIASRPFSSAPLQTLSFSS